VTFMARSVCVLDAVIGYVDGVAIGVERGAGELRHGRIDAAADRGSVRGGAWWLEDLRGKILGGGLVANHRPVDDGLVQKLIAISPSAPERTARMTRGLTMAAGVARESWRLEWTFGHKHGPEQTGPSARVTVSTVIRFSLHAATQA
jgi:hypothetical protein